MCLVAGVGETVLSRVALMQSRSAFVFALEIESSAASKMESLQARHSLKRHCHKRHKLQSGMNTSLKQWFPQKLAGE